MSNADPGSCDDHTSLSTCAEQIDTLEAEIVSLKNSLRVSSIECRESAASAEESIKRSIDVVCDMILEVHSFYGRKLKDSAVDAVEFHRSRPNLVEKVEALMQQTQALKAELSRQQIELNTGEVFEINQKGPDLFDDPESRRRSLSRSLSRRLPHKRMDSEILDRQSTRYSSAELQQKFPDDSELDEHGDHHYLPNDTYSYLAVTEYSNKNGLPATIFFMAMFVSAIQLVTLLIFVMDVLDLNSSNVIGVPAGVSFQVQVSQVVALLISCWNQDEVRASFNVLYLGYNEKLVRKVGPATNLAKWYFSILVRFFLGCISLMVTFILVLNSITVRDVMLDFAAVTFVSELDNGAFLLSSWGYMGRAAQMLTMKITSTPIYSEQMNQRKVKIPRLGSLVAVLIIVCGLWLVVAVRQATGHYLHKVVYIQFGDEVSPAIGAFTGQYIVEVGNDLGHGTRIDYVDVASRKAKFSYCLSDSRWVFQYGSALEGLDSDPCWSISGSDTIESMDFVRASGIQWDIWDEESMLHLPLQHFFLHALDTYFGKPCRGNRDCGNRLYCGQDKTCHCPDRHFGLNCEFLDLCPAVEIDPHGSDFTGTRNWSRKYRMVTKDDENSPFTVYDKPVYIGEKERPNGLLDVMIFTGRRWILTDNRHFWDYEATNQSTTRDFVEFLSTNFHAYWSNYSFFYISGPVDKGLPTDSSTSVGFEWFRLETRSSDGATLRSDKSFWNDKVQIDTKLICGVCNNETNPCFYDGICRSDGTCDCITGSSGTLCQIPPSGNGLCDDFFNYPEFGFDGGDCCRETCINSEEHSCGYGVVHAGKLSAVEFIGFPNCKDTKFSLKISGSKTLYEIIERGSVRCGIRHLSSFVEFTNGTYSGFEVDLCRAIAAAALGDPNAVEVVETTSTTRFRDLAANKFDVMMRSSYNAERDIYEGGTGTGFSFVNKPVIFDGLLFGGIPPFAQCADRVDTTSPECLDLKICVSRDTTIGRVTQSLFPESMVVLVEEDWATIPGLEAGICNVVAGPNVMISPAQVRKSGFTGPEYHLGSNIYTKEPMTITTRQDDRVWSKFVNWVFEALIQAEESGITMVTATDKLHTTDAFGERFQNMFKNAVAANGNYGELYEKHMEHRFPRGGLNEINTGDSGLMYAYPFGKIATVGPGPIIGGSLDGIRKHGVLNCGVETSPGFAVLNEERGVWHGFEVDFCRGIAAAIFNGSPNVNIIPLVPSDRFVSLGNGVVDILMGRTTHNLARELREASTGKGFDFTPPIFYDGMEFGGLAPYVKCADHLIFDNVGENGCSYTKICVQDGTTHLESMRDVLKIPEANIVVAINEGDFNDKFASGECNVVVGESIDIEYTYRQTVKKNYIVGSRKFTTEPLAIVSRADDAQFSDFLRWMVHGFFYAAEEGITKNDPSRLPSNMLLFGSGFSGMWRHAVATVGNYNEIFDRNFAGIVERKGRNELNNGNSPQYFAIPGVYMKN